MILQRLKSATIAFALVLSLILVALPAKAQEAPPKLQAALLMKILAFYTNLGDGEFTIHVIGSAEVASELKKFLGKPAGKATLKEVTEGGGPPSGAAQVVYVGDNVAGATSYTQGQKVLSVTGKPAFVSDGVTLGIGVENKKPKILLNLSSSKAEGINWAPGILKVAETIK